MDRRVIKYRYCDVMFTYSKSRRYASFLMAAIITNGEKVRLSGGTSVAVVETQCKVYDSNEAENNRRVNGLGIYAKELDSKVKGGGGNRCA